MISLGAAGDRRSGTSDAHRERSQVMRLRTGFAAGACLCAMMVLSAVAPAAQLDGAFGRTLADALKPKVAQPGQRLQVATQGVVTPTMCPAAATHCPPTQTQCPAIETRCPSAATHCPPSATQCPAV